MAVNIRLLQRRIKTARNISQITRAMEMVAASKVRRAQDQTIASKPYAEKLRMLVSNLVGRVEDVKHPYLAQLDKGKTLLLLFSTDKGLAGSLNTNILREFIHIGGERNDTEIIAIGRKLERTVVRLGGVLVADFPFGTTMPTFDKILPISKLVVDVFLKGEYMRVICLYTQFLSLRTQKPTVLTLLPVVAQVKVGVSEEAILPYTFEPDAGSLLTALMPHYLELTLYQIFLESYASEQAARMIAMHQASENAKDVIWQLSLFYNKARQERITNELLDITGGTIGVAT